MARVKNKTFDESNDAKKVSKMIGVRCISKSMDEYDALVPYRIVPGIY